MDWFWNNWTFQTDPCHWDPWHSIYIPIRKPCTRPRMTLSERHTNQLQKASRVELTIFRDPTLSKVIILKAVSSQYMFLNTLLMPSPFHRTNRIRQEGSLELRHPLDRRSRVQRNQRSHERHCAIREKSDFRSAHIHQHDLKRFCQGTPRRRPRYQHVHSTATDRPGSAVHWHDPYQRLQHSRHLRICLLRYFCAVCASTYTWVGDGRKAAAGDDRHIVRHLLGHHAHLRLCYLFDRGGNNHCRTLCHGQNP